MSGEARCATCGAFDSAGATCARPARATQANVAGLGWRYVPNRVRDCIARAKADERLGQMIRDAYRRLREPGEPETPAPGIL